MTRVFIDGEAGTTGLQIRQRLAGRHDITLVSIDADRRKDPAARRELLNEADVSILCLPDDAAREAVALIESPKARVIDASSAHRVSAGWVYGFAEMAQGQSERIANAQRVTNPGCWPQGVIAALRPLVTAGLITADFPITVNGISGYSGGGKSMIAAYETAGDGASPFMPYGLTFAHKHLPEMAKYAALSNSPLFMPAVGNYAQGMLTAVPLQLSLLAKTVSGAALHGALADHFATVGNGFVEVAPLEKLERSPALDPESLNSTNRMRLHVFADDAKRQALLIAIYDNLGKGASGAAVQNLNIMIGADQAAGVDLPVAA